MSIQLNNVTFSWSPTLPPVLDIPKLSISTGERIFLYGPSGCGKTTLLNLISGICTPDTGDILINDTLFSDLSSSRKDTYRGDHMGIIFQMFNLVPYMSVLENVLLPVKFSLKRRARLSRAELRHNAACLLDKMGLSDNNLYQRSVSHLSTGQQQRVAAARALMGKPEIIIADEPTSALDAAYQHSFLEVLLTQAQSQNSTILFVSHDQRLSSLFETRINLQDLNQTGREGP